MPRHRDREYKPLLFDTTLRNPERIKSFLSIIKKYENTFLNNAVIDLIVKDVLKAKIYTTKYQVNISKYKRILNDENAEFSDKDIQDIVDNTSVDHQEGGFDRGWPSRFFTWFKFIRALGFVYFALNEKIKISETGNLLIKALEDGDGELENLVFRNAMARFHRSSPYIFSANENKPFPFLVASILKLKELTNNPNAGIYRFEIPYFLCWKNSDVDEIVNYILEQRNRLGSLPSDESIYENAKQILNITPEQERRFKISNICKEMPDEYIRKMRLTGMISLRGAGHYLDINSDSIEYAKIIRDQYLNCQNFKTEKEYFEYASGWDERLGKIGETKPVNFDEYMKNFLKQVNTYDLDLLHKELLILEKSTPRSEHPVFKLLDPSIRLEFLTALIIKKTYPSVEVFPNYSADDEGIPKSTAGGNQADIYCNEDKVVINVEVTMLRNSQQNSREFSSVITHLQESRRTCDKSFAVFIAPVIHQHTVLFMTAAPIAFNDYNLKCSLNTIAEFSNRLKTSSKLCDFRKY